MKNMWEKSDYDKLYSLLYGIDVETESNLEKRLSDVRREKIWIIEIITDKMSKLNGKTRDEFLNKNINALEIGPGEGIMANWLSEYVGQVHCFDISKSMLDACNTYNSKNTNVSTYHIGYNVDKSKQISDYLKKDSVDMAYSQSVFIHLSPFDFYIYFKDLYPILKTNALIWIDIIDTDVEEFTFNEQELKRQLNTYKEFVDSSSQYNVLKTLYYINSKSAMKKIGKELGYDLIWSENSKYNPSNVSLIFKKV